jgi:hypothetical protein
VLLILFYFFNAIIALMRFIMFFCGFFSCGFVLWDWFCLWLPQCMCAVVDILVSLALMIGWSQTEHWMLGNLLAFSICVIGIVSIRIESVRILVAVAIGFMIYDVYWVFFSARAFGESVMLSVAKKATARLPVAFSVDAGGSSMIGTGDIVFPGFMLNLFMRFDSFHGTSLFNWAFAGYIIGLIICVVAVRLTSLGQPALLWIFPSILGITFIRAWIQGVFGDLWRDGARSPETGNGEELAQFRQDLLEASRVSDAQSNASEQSEERGEVVNTHENETGAN